MKGIAVTLAVCSLFWGNIAHAGALAEADEFLDETFRERTVADSPVKVRVGGQFRYRMEYRNDFNFNDRTYEDDAIHFLRTRLNLSLALGPYVTLFAEGQDAESFADQAAHRSAGYVNRLDLHQLYAEFTSPVPEVPVTVKAGRQKLAYGDERFVGSFEWSNVARVFDAVKVVWKPKDWFQFDAWFSQVVTVNRSQPDSANHDDNFYGLYATLKPVKDHALDTFLFIRRSRDRVFTGEIAGHAGKLNEYTFGNRLVGKKSGFDYGFEWAIQAGTRASETIEAWALHSRVGYTFDELPWDPRLSFEYNHGSGDSDPRDGKIETFDNLFPTNHMHYGYMDFFSLRNLDNLKLGLDAAPHASLKLIAAFHWFFLDTASGAWQNAGGGVVRPRTPGASQTVGQELDLLAKWKVMKHLELWLGYSHFFAGPYVEDTGAHDDADFLYVQSILNF